MTDNWTKLKWRLQAIANSEIERDRTTSSRKQKGSASNVALVDIDVLILNNSPAMWFSPVYRLIEPKYISVPAFINNIPAMYFDFEMREWETVISELKKETGRVKKTLLLVEGKPAGWVDTT